MKFTQNRDFVFAWYSWDREYTERRLQIFEDSDSSDDNDE